jgi:hypothetical protein
MSNPRIDALLAEFSSKLATIVREEARAEVRAALDAALGGSPSSKPTPPKAASKPGASKPGASKPGASKPGASKPGASKPGASKPSPSPAKAPAASSAPKKFPLVGAPAPKKADAKKPDAKKPAGKRIRRSVADLDRDAGRLVSAVRTAGPQGLLNEEARAQLKMEKTEWQGTLKHALDTKLVRVEGQRRAMRVFVL